mmetsp:Transcript_62229/g.122977  ORF Transcript_62229/g.122977 Transcript_62229/m.122977 type:complete len:203 (-) Transcript_62229:1262-1870(-)
MPLKPWTLSTSNALTTELCTCNRCDVVYASPWGSSRDAIRSPLSVCAMCGRAPAPRSAHHNPGAPCPSRPLVSRPSRRLLAPPLLGLLGCLVEDGARLLLERVPVDHLLLQILLELLLRRRVLHRFHVLDAVVVDHGRLERQRRRLVQCRLSKVSDKCFLLLLDSIEDDLEPLLALQQHLHHVVVSENERGLLKFYALEALG